MAGNITCRRQPAGLMNKANAGCVVLLKLLPEYFTFSVHPN